MPNPSFPAYLRLGWTPTLKPSMKGNMDIPAEGQTANRLYLAHKDMEDAKRYLEALGELVRLQEQRGNSEYFDHCEAIMVAAIVAYCRAFKESRSKGLADKCIKAEELDCLMHRPDLLSLHQLIEKRRDKAIAHGDWEMRSTELLPLKDGTAVFRKFPVPNIMSDIDPQVFWELAHQVSVECSRRGYDLDRARIQDSTLTDASQ